MWNYKFEIYKTTDDKNYYFTIENNTNSNIDCVIQSNRMYYGAFRLDKGERRTVDRSVNSTALITKIDKSEEIYAEFYPCDYKSNIVSGVDVFDIDLFYGFRTHPDKSGLKLRKAIWMPINPQEYYVIKRNI